MTGVLADLALEYEGAVAAALRLSRAIEEAAGGDAEAAAFRRIAAPVLKYWVCKRAPGHAAEALECLGGGGYVESSRLPPGLPGSAAHVGVGRVGERAGARLLRALTTSRAWPALLGELHRARGGNRLLDTAAGALADQLASGSPMTAAPDPSPAWPPARCAPPCWSASPLPPWPEGRSGPAGRRTGS